MIIGYTKHITAADGVITWDAGMDAVGDFQEDHLKQLEALGEATR